MFVTKPFSTGNSQDSFIGFVYCLLSITSNVFDSLINKILHKDFCKQIVVSSQNVVFLTFSNPYLLLSQNYNLDFSVISGPAVLIMILIAILEYSKLIFNLYSISYAPLTFVTPFRFSSIVFTLILGLVFLNEDVDIGNLIGAAGIVGSYFVKLYLDSVKS